jgi:predicted lipoprotein with Yx(FWY)xxD motif
MRLHPTYQPEETSNMKFLLAAAGFVLVAAACGGATQTSRAAASPTPRPILN